MWRSLGDILHTFSPMSFISRLCHRFVLALQFTLAPPLQTEEWDESAVEGLVIPPALRVHVALQVELTRRRGGGHLEAAGQTLAEDRGHPPVAEPPAVAHVPRARVLLGHAAAVTHGYRRCRHRAGCGRRGRRRR